MKNDPHYIPALGAKWLTPLYDPFIHWLIREDQFKRHLIHNARIAPDHSVLDLGCGTATLTIMVKQAHPAASVVGLDGDPKVLEIGRAKALRAGANITLEEGLAYQLPYPDQTFDRVLSSLLLHHLTTTDKQRTLQEVARVLRLGGELHVADIGAPKDFWARRTAWLTRHFERTADNLDGRLPDMFRAAGLENIAEVANYNVLANTLTLYRAQKLE